MKRRQFIAGIGGAAAWPVVARAQQGDRVRRIGVLMPYDENDPEGNLRYSAFTQSLADLGWTEGRNVRMNLRWGRGDTDRMRVLAQELVGLQPDIILASGTPPTAAVQRETRTIPIVFSNAADPVASGFVAGLNQPGGNITGFGAYEASMGGKWLELLSEIAPGLKRAAIIFNPDTAPQSTFVPSTETAARSLKIAPIIARVHSDLEIETTISALGREPGGGLVAIPDGFLQSHRALPNWSECTFRRRQQLRFVGQLGKRNAVPSNPRTLDACHDDKWWNRMSGRNERSAHCRSRLSASTP
jgi:putative ABC transport system substrate-binding protein